MPVIQRIVKPKTHKGKRAIVNKEPKLIENNKQTLFLQGRKSSDVVSKCLKDLYSLKKPDAIMMRKKNDVIPFEDATPIEIISKKKDTSLFIFGSHTKKRPNNLILGRMYDHQLLDMIELGVAEYKGLDAFRNEKITTGTKPCLLFMGPDFEQDETLKRIQNLLVDLFQRDVVKSVRLQGLEYILVFTALEGNIYMRSYRIHLKKSGCHTPRVELTEIGPSFDFKVGRTKLASEDLFKLACKKPKALKAKKVKNVSRDAFGSKLGRLHLKQDSILKLQTRKMKGLKKTSAERKEMRNRKKSQKSPAE